MFESLKAALDWLRDEGRVIKEAPVAFAFALLVAAAAVFGFLEWHHSAIEDGLQAALEAKESENDFLKERLKDYSSHVSESAHINTVSSTFRIVRVRFPPQSDVQMVRIDLNVTNPGPPTSFSNWKLAMIKDEQNVLLPDLKESAANFQYNDKGHPHEDALPTGQIALFHADFIYALSPSIKDMFSSGSCLEVSAYDASDRRIITETCAP